MYAVHARYRITLSLQPGRPGEEQGPENDGHWAQGRLRPHLILRGKEVGELLVDIWGRRTPSTTTAPMATAGRSMSQRPQARAMSSQVLRQVPRVAEQG